MTKNHNTAINDREIVFSMLERKDWTALIETFTNNDSYKFISSDPVLNPVVDKYLIDGLINIVPDVTRAKEFRYNLEQFFLLHISRSHHFKFSKEYFPKLIVRIVELQEDLEQSNHYALHAPNEPICIEVIERYKANQPQLISHSQESTISLTENRNIHSVDSAIPLFKSKQEYQFYKAARGVYQMFLVFPNVALNAVIDFDSIKEKLTTQEKTYFFTALVDCVVVDTENDYKPIKFIELDSPDHDNEAAQKRDNMKDNILSIAGQKLYRIRQLANVHTENDFEKLIRETMKD